MQPPSVHLILEQNEIQWKQIIRCLIDRFDGPATKITMCSRACLSLLNDSCALKTRGDRFRGVDHLWPRVCPEMAMNWSWSTNTTV